MLTKTESSCPPSFSIFLKFVTLITMNLYFHYEPLFVPIELTSIKRKWFKSTLEKFLALPFHTDNWSTGANRTQWSAMQQLFNVLLPVLPDDAPTPDIVPTWLGGVQAEWHRKGLDLEIYANPGEAVEYFFNSGEEEDEGNAWDNRARLNGYAKAIV